MNPDRKSPSSRFYFGLAMIALLLLAGALVLPSARPLADAHANPVPATPLPAKVLVAPGSNLYHAGPLCPYAHHDGKLITVPQAEREGLSPCPYCLGNSSAHLTPTVLPRRHR